MAETIDSYDQDMAFGEHAVEIDVRAWEYGATYEVEVSGWLRGADVLEEAVRKLAERLRIEAEGAAERSMPMHDGEGRTLIHRDVEGRGVDWLRDCVVAVRIVGAAPGCGTASSGPVSAAVAVT